MSNVYDIDSRRQVNRIVPRFFSLLSSRPAKERAKEIFRISKPRNRLTGKEDNAAREIICVGKKRPHLNESERESEREKQHTSNSILSLLEERETDEKEVKE